MPPFLLPGFAPGSSGPARPDFPGLQKIPRHATFLRRREIVMAHAELFAGALSQLLRHDLSGCRRATRQAADLLDRLADLPELDAETAQLCERMSRRLAGEDGVPCR